MRNGLRRDASTQASLTHALTLQYSPDTAGAGGHRLVIQHLEKGLSVAELAAENGSAYVPSGGVKTEARLPCFASDEDGMTGCHPRGDDSEPILQSDHWLMTCQVNRLVINWERGIGFWFRTLLESRVPRRDFPQL